uniref:Uncharacterized protein n=1 Tax=Arundo donax TaxID=35708 RepID=A0A0A9GXK9_ARUDO
MLHSCGLTINSVEHVYNIFSMYKAMLEKCRIHLD